MIRPKLSGNGTDDPPVKRQYRLRDKKRFQEVRERGRCWTHPLCVMCVLPNGLPYSRFGFTASRRVGKAVMRNRSRRRLREIVRQRMTYIRPGYDLVFIARPRMVTATYQELVQAVEDVLHRAGLWAGPEEFAGKGK